MRMLQLIKRICKQVLRDKRTLALLFLAPIFVITLLNYIFPDPDDEVTIAAVNVNDEVIDILEDNDIIVKQENEMDIQSYLEEGNASGVLEEKDGNWTLTILNDNPMDEGPAIQGSSQAVMETNLNDLSDNIDNMISNMEDMSAGVEEMMEQLPPEVAENMDINMDTNINTDIDSEIDMDNDPISVEYIYGDESNTFFEILNPILVSFFVFFFVFLIAGMSMLKERSSGTLEKLLSTPIRKSEIVFGYLFGYGIFAILQTAIIILYSVYILDMEIAGSISNMFIINIFLSFVALGLGLLLSTFVSSEFQMIQFIPLVIIPQIFFSGMLNVDTMETWLQWIAPMMPLYYAGNAMIDVVLKGFTFGEILAPLSILFLFIVVFVSLNILGMRRYRKV
ncbi:antibiotic ABC transporter permease [Oceanobacillus oncorhynchi subsp. incaldanensis]|uniref:ABC transporter permease n=1 Tax=Oceanobacillus oncorhynchi TaxID=545501 RepID=UPI001B0E942A|nr:ABC transporter permease [Oceanobacillus oncorhynchi]GIO21055.1 antibiotic ABC transporter permease [Oceanobacillus oncorhynchi subsp. incaldanensis]